jgi:hypothetical protein
MAERTDILHRVGASDALDLSLGALFKLTGRKVVGATIPCASVRQKGRGFLLELTCCRADAVNR